MPVASLLLVPRDGQTQAAADFVSTLHGHSVVDIVDDTLVVLCDHTDEQYVRDVWAQAETHPTVASLTLTYVALDDDDNTEESEGV